MIPGDQPICLSTIRTRIHLVTDRWSVFNRQECSMSDSHPPDPPDSAGGPVDPMAMLAFLQRLVETMSRGGDVTALMADAPPGFEALFADAERRVQAGEVPDLSTLMGLFGAGVEDEDDEDSPPGDEAGDESSG